MVTLCKDACVTPHALNDINTDFVPTNGTITFCPLFGPEV